MMNRISFFATVLLIIITSYISAQSKNAGPVFVVIHIDAMPQYAKPAAALLDSLRHDSLKDAGSKSFKVLLEEGKTNHFTLVEEWADKDAYNTHISAVHTRQFRDKIQPMLGSPFDERIHEELK